MHTCDDLRPERCAEHRRGQPDRTGGACRVLCAHRRTVNRQLREAHGIRRKHLLWVCHIPDTRGCRRTSSRDGACMGEIEQFEETWAVQCDMGRAWWIVVRMKRRRHEEPGQNEVTEGLRVK
eukprot:1335424-Pleurochrysis_carterae.AAC.2